MTNARLKKVTVKQKLVTLRNSLSSPFLFFSCAADNLEVMVQGTQNIHRAWKTVKSTHVLLRVCSISVVHPHKRNPKPKPVSLIVDK